MQDVNKIKRNVYDFSALDPYTKGQNLGRKVRTAVSTARQTAQAVGSKVGPVVKEAARNTLAGKVVRTAQGVAYGYEQKRLEEKSKKYTR